MTVKKFVPCSARFLPDDEQYAAALFAMEVNPVNAAPVQGLSKLGINPDQLAIALITSKFHGAGGVDLSVGFLSNASAALIDKIVNHMNAWNQYCNATFTVYNGPAANADIRISLGAGGYWSYLGTDCLRIPRGQPTMNLQGFSLSTPDSEYRRVVRHETGHTLGCPHEHMRPDIVARLNPQKTIAYFGQTQGWSPTEVQQQVLTPIDVRSLMPQATTPTAEVDSIMCYQLPGSITNDGQPIPGGVDITSNDGLYLSKAYPKAIVVPTPPPPPPPPSGAAESIITLGVKGTAVRIISVK